MTPVSQPLILQSTLGSRLLEPAAEFEFNNLTGKPKATVVMAGAG